MTAETRTRAACLIGWPAAHSRSPLIHHYWLRTLGIAGGYNIEAVPPEEFADFVQHLAKRGFVGANVTIPHKERALALTEPDERAKAVGAANTLWFRTASCAPPIPTSKVSSAISTPARPAGIGPRKHWCSAPVARRARWCLACSSAASSACISPTAPRSAPQALAEQFGANGSCRGVGAAQRRAAACGTAGQYHVARHDGQPALDIDVGKLPRRRRRRSRLCAAGDAAA